MKPYHLLFLALLFTLTACSPAPDPARVFSVQGKYEDVWDDVKNALIDRGLVVNNVAHISKMLDRTGKDLGYKKRVYLNARSLEFCSASVSRKTMEADPSNIIYCPYAISVYETTREPGKIYVAYRHVTPTGSAESRKTLKALNKLVSGIVKDGVGK